MYRLNFKVAFRHILRQRLYTATNIAGLSLALTCCLLLAVMVNHELSFDRFHHNADRLYLLAHKEVLQTGEHIDGSECAPFAPALKQDVAGIETYVRMYSPEVDLSYSNQSTHEEILCADQQFFEVFSFPLVQGDSTKVLSDPRSVVLSERAAKRWFGDGPALGNTLLLRGAIPLAVTGVMKNIPANSSFSADYVVPFLLLKEAGLDIDKWAGMDYRTFLLLDKNVPVAALERSINKRGHELEVQVGGKDRESLTWFLQRASEIHLRGLAGQGGTLLLVNILIAVGLVILLIACVNFVNISTAQSMSRAKEVGLRKTAGAQRRQLIVQFVGEAALQVIVALLTALALTELLLPSFGQLLGTDMSWHLGAYPTVALVLVAGVVVSLLAGLYPALHFSAHRPSTILRGGGLRPRGLTLRRALVVAQFALAIILTASAIMIARQMNYVATKDLGFARTGLYGFLAPEGIQRQFSSFKQELLKDPNIRDVSFAAQNIANIGSSLGPKVDWDGKDPQQQLEIHMDWVSYDYARTLGLTMAQGRFYSPEYPSDATDGIVLNERAITLMGIKDPVGKRFSYWGKDKRIIGVTKDFHFEPMRQTLKPMVLILGKSPSIVYVRLSEGEASRSLAYIESTIKSFAPGAAADIMSFEEINRLNYTVEQRMLSIGRLAVMLAIVIACMGLFGLSALTIQQRTRELGVRKVLGASESRLLALLAKESMLLVLVSCVIAVPAAYFLTRVFLQQYAYHTNIGVSPFALAAALAFAAAGLAVGYHTIRATRRNPVDSLRYE